ncbi:MAG TPA: GNAT family N-acetyltransferase [Thermoleophilia bacterium]|nr:GNAT family N-acetyltransferase [Thermoleophilia bacterium]
MGKAPAVRLEPWGDGDLPLLTRLLGDQAMTEHIGGPESPEKLAERQARYAKPGGPGEGRMFKIVDAASGDGIGSVGYWEREWRGGQAYETGWSVLPEFQGQGIAREATARVIGLAAAERKHRFLHAFPSVDNAPSNAICRRLGFTLLGPVDVEYPPGREMRSNDWRLDLWGSP